MVFNSHTVSCEKILQLKVSSSQKVEKRKIAGKKKKIVEKNVKLKRKKNEKKTVHSLIFIPAISAISFHKLTE